MRTESNRLLRGYPLMSTSVVSFKGPRCRVSTTTHVEFMFDSLTIESLTLCRKWSKAHACGHSCPCPATISTHTDRQADRHPPTYTCRSFDAKTTQAVEVRGRETVCAPSSCSPFWWLVREREIGVEGKVCMWGQQSPFV